MNQSLDDAMMSLSPWIGRVRATEDDIAMTMLPPIAAMAPSDQASADTIQLSETLVFRYSAVTWNSHRIHYDADYARRIEGYEHTVQNGGLTMQLMIDAALKRAPSELRGLSARLTYP